MFKQLAAGTAGGDGEETEGEIATVDLDDVAGGDGGDSANALLKRLLSSKNRVAPGASGGVFADAERAEDTNGDADAGAAGNAPRNAMKQMLEALQRSGVQV